MLACPQDEGIPQGVRLWIKGPWYRTGEGEKLAVLLWPIGDSSSVSAEQRRCVSEWGVDPLWKTDGQFETLRREHFQEGQDAEADLILPGNKGSLPVRVLLFDVKDKPDGLYAADILLMDKGLYWPFVKLVVCRYQPQAVEVTLGGKQVALQPSEATVVDFVQLAPDRTAKITRLEGKVQITVTGTGYSARIGTTNSGQDQAYSGPSIMRVELESEAGRDRWVPVYQGQKPVSGSLEPGGPAGTGTRSWAGALLIPDASKRERLRVVVKEFELVPKDTDQGRGAPGEHAERLVYADALEIPRG